MCRSTIFSAVLLSLAGCGGAYCDESSESVARARSVSTEELADIHSFATAATEPISGRIDKFPNAPKALVALEPSFIRMRPGEAVIYLEACSFDYKVAMVTNMRTADAKFIRLQWGGSPDTWGSEILWRSAESISSSQN